MNKPAYLAALVACVCLALSCGGNEKRAGAEQKAVAVTVAVAKPGNISVQRVYTGSLEGIKQARIYASIPEAVVELPVAEGSYVTAGQPVILLDKTGVASRYKQSQAVYLEAKDSYEKMEKLYAQGAVSQQAYNSAKTRYEVSLANFMSAKQQVELTSPISGILTDLSVNVGEYVPVGVPLATVAQIDKMRLTLFIDNRDIGFIRKGQRAEVAVDVGGEAAARTEGMVVEVSKSADPETRLFKVELEIDNESGSLRPGMFARATIAVAELKDVLTVPREAVFKVEGIAKVFKLESGHAKEQTITVGQASPDSYQIVDGLSVGDTVVVLGRAQVTDGSLVRVVSAEDSLPAGQLPQEG